MQTNLVTLGDQDNTTWIRELHFWIFLKSNLA